jgi:hypothetical protein
VAELVDAALSKRAYYGFKSRCPLRFWIIIFASMGALTSKPYAFTARPWELTEHTTVDYLDSAYSPLRVNGRGGVAVRVLPNVRYSTTDEWISDRARFSYDSFLARSRLRGFTFSFRGQSHTRSVVTPSTITYFMKRLASAGSLDVDWRPLERARFFELFWGRSGRGSVQTAQVSVPVHFELDHQRYSTFFVAGISLRYTHPVYFSVLRRLNGSTATVFELGNTTAISNFSLGSGVGAFFHLFRFRSRASLFLANSLTIVSSRLWRLVAGVLSGFTVLVLPEAPGTFQLPEATLPRLQAHFGSFRPTRPKTADLQLGLPHPFQTDTTVTTLAGMVLPVPAILPPGEQPALFSDFYSGVSSTVVFFEAPAASAPTALASLYSTYNYFDHYAGWSFLSNSTSLLLTLKRNEDYRHSHFCHF